MAPQPSKERAEQLILEILRQAGGWLGRTKLYKAFWLAHLYYANENLGFLSDWPVVRMPKGPGINDGTRLLRDLAEAGAIETEEGCIGPFPEKRSRLLDGGYRPALDPAGVAAVQSALAFIAECGTAKDLSDWSHGFSRSWRETPDGYELDIYSDQIPDDEYLERKRLVDGMKEAAAEIFG